MTKASCWIGLGLLVSGLAQAQGVYRIVGPDGRVTFSDRPPAEAQTAPVPTPPRSTPPSPTTTLPFELRQIVARYPVTLHASADCAPCATSRQWLIQRGIPFTEKTVTSPDDAQALQRLSGELTLPVLTVGAQVLRGFSASEWGPYLDAAGYPATSKLPPGYRPPPAQPLAPHKPVAATTPLPEAPSIPTEPALPPVTPPVGNPAGIRF